MIWTQYHFHHFPVKDAKHDILHGQTLDGAKLRILQNNWFLFWHSSNTASQNELGNVPFHFYEYILNAYMENWHDFVEMLLICWNEMFGRIQKRGYMGVGRVRGFLWGRLGRSLKFTNFISLLLRFSFSSWVNFSHLYISSSFSIWSKFSN